MVDIKSLTLPELQEEMEKLGEKTYRAKQIYGWMHEKLVDRFEGMTNLSGALRERLKKDYELVGWKYDRKRTDAVPSRQFCLHLFSGRLPDGLPVLCIYA